QMQDKKVVFGTGVYGFHLVKGRLTVNHNEADVVRLIFDLYMKEGMGSNLICRELQNRGIPSPSGSPNWVAKTVLYILKNEKYAGILLQKKSITTDYLAHKRIANDGIEDFVITQNNHDAIISRELFDETQKEIVNRRNSEPNKAKHGNRYVWSGKLVCGTCGNKFIRKLWYCKTKYEKSVWQCNEQRKNGNKKVDEQGRERGCDCLAAFEETLTDAVQLALQSTTQNKAKITAELKQDIIQALSEKPDNTETINALGKKIKSVHSKKSKLIELFTDSIITRAEFDIKNEQYENSLLAYTAELASLAASGEDAKDLHERFALIGKAVEKIANFGEFSEEVCRECLEKIVVHNREQLDVYLAGNLDSPFYYEVTRFAQPPTRNESSTACGSYIPLSGKRLLRECR
ncbi:MAG: recombinase family protein, partial [Oscillospiraceae bacterium]|nr:recombinase family protein [Oscillospiraceae bacterium]